MSITAVTAETLNSHVEFDSPFRIVGQRGGHAFIENPLENIYAPEVTLYVDKDGNADGEEEIDLKPWDEATNWEAVNGYSGQYCYSGPTMHSSEYLGGKMARDVLEDTGAVYVLVTVECSPNWEDPTEEEYDDVRTEPAGWMLLKWKGNN